MLPSVNEDGVRWRQGSAVKAGSSAGIQGRLASQWNRGRAEGRCTGQHLVVAAYTGFLWRQRSQQPGEGLGGGRPCGGDGQQGPGRHGAQRRVLHPQAALQQQSQCGGSTSPGAFATHRTGPAGASLLSSCS